MSEKGFLFYSSWLENIVDLNDEDFAALMKAVLNYGIKGEEAKFDNKALNMAFRFIKQDIDRNEDKYQSISRARSEAGRKGGAPLGNQNATSKNKQNKQNNLKDKDNDNVKDKDKDKDKENVDLSSSFFDCYNQTSKPFGEISLSGSQTETISGRTEAEIKSFWSEVEQSEWLKGQPFGKVLNLFDNVVSGQYRGKTESVLKAPTIDKVERIIHG